MVLKFWFPEHFWKLTCRKIARRCGAKHISKSKVLKTDGLGPLFEVEMFKNSSKSKCTKHTRFGAHMLNNCTPLWRKAYFQAKMLKTSHVRTAFKVSDVVLRHLPKNDGRCGTFQEDLQRCISRGRRSTRDMLFISDVKRSGRWFPERHWYEAVSSALSVPLLKEVSQNCFVFDAINFENWGSLARFWSCQGQKVRNLAELLRFQTCRKTNR